MKISRFLKRMHHPPTNIDGDKLIAAGIVKVLQEQRLSGEVLLQLPRKEDMQLTGAMGLKWQNDQLILAFNPSRLTQLSKADLTLLLEHEALHVIWEHPVRYENYPHPSLVQVATDVAVNQYLPEAPRKTVTLGQLQRLLRQKIAPYQDSQDYLTLLGNLPIEQQEKLQQAGIKLKGKQQGEAVDEDQQSPLDSHQGWKNAKLNNAHRHSQVVRLANIRKVLQNAYHRTPQRDRGLLPGNIREKLQRTFVERSVNWQQILRKQFGIIAHGHQDSHARFNRRQPLRMDLPGMVAELTPMIDIFIDNSGSVSDEELGQTLAIIQKMLSQFRLTATVYSFDAKVTSKTRIHPGQKVGFVRHGGGGTSFQCVFDFLHNHHFARYGRLTIIITDGWGEQKLSNYHYQNVYWLMMTKADQLSVIDPPGKVLEMKGNNDDNAS